MAAALSFLSGFILSITPSQPLSLSLLDYEDVWVGCDTLVIHVLPGGGSL